MKKKIILTGGGTAGHVWPLLAIAKKIKNEYEILYLGGGDEREKQLVESKGIEYKKILSGKYRRYFSLMNFIDPFKVLIGIIQSKWHIFRFNPDVIFAKGGYVTVPVGIAAFILKKRLIIHESDAVMGLSNRILSRFSKKILTAFPKKYYSKKYHQKIIWTGVPVREEVLTGDRGKALSVFGFNANIPIVLVIGGSSGARAINSLIAKNLDKLLDFSQVIHITGKKDYPIIRKRAAQLDSTKRDRFRYFEFVTSELADIFSLSDIVVSRSGATTLFELAALGKSVIFIPYPQAASNHQYKNAKVLEKKQAAIIMDQEKTTSENLIAQIKRLVDNENARINLQKNIKKYYKNNSMDLISEEIDKITKAGKGLLE